MTMNASYRRLNYFTKKKFQSRFILRFLLISLVCNAFAVILFNILSFSRIDSLLFSMTLPSASTGALFIHEAFWANGIAFIFISLVLVFAMEGLRSRISGALFRIRVDMSRLIKGDLGARVALQEGEEFRDFADELNIMGVELSHRFTDIKAGVRQIDRTVGALRVAKGFGERRELAAKLREQVVALESQIALFKRRP